MGVADELTGQAVNAFVSLKNGNEVNDQIKKDLILQVRKSIGPFAAPKAIFPVPDLPKTRSGKIMRRILRKILAGEEDQLGDITTVSFSSCSACSSHLRVFLPEINDAFPSYGRYADIFDSCPIHPLWTRSSTLCTAPRRSRRGRQRGWA